MGRRRRSRPLGAGLGGAAAVVVVATLWWWSTGAADPVAPGPPPPGIDPAAAPSGPGATGDAGSGPPGAPAATIDATSGGAALEAVRAAVRATGEVPTARFALVVVPGDDPAGPPLTEASGVVDLAGGNVSMTLWQWDGSGAAATVLEAVAIGDDLYVRSPALDIGEVEPRWWRMRVAPGGEGPPVAVSGLLSLVGTAVAAEQLGPGAAGGVEFTRYGVTLPGDGAAPALGGPPEGGAELGVDGEGLVRVVEVRGRGASGAAAGVAVVVRLTLDGFGTPVSVVAPDPGQVRELTGVAPAAGG